MNASHRRPVLAVAAALLAIAALAPAAAAAATPLAAIDLGDPSVLSQRGQKLRVALPYGSPPGEHVSPTRFEVVSVQAPDGWRAPDPSRFTIAAPERRNVVYLLSDQAVDAPELTVTVRVADQADGTQTWRVPVPPARASAAPVSAAAAERAARRGPTRERTGAR